MSGLWRGRSDHPRVPRLRAGGKGHRSSHQRAQNPTRKETQIMSKTFKHRLALAVGTLGLVWGSIANAAPLATVSGT